MSVTRPHHRVRRSPGRARYDRDSVHRVLDRGIVAHIAFAESGRPVCIPMLHACVEDEVLIHGSSASRLMRTLGTGVPACLTVTTLNGLVLARSVFEHSANYDSVVIHGRFRVVDGERERLTAYRTFTERLLPGRWDEVRPPSAKELKATEVLALPIGDEVAVKSRTGGPTDDDSEDAALDTWAGEIPLATTHGAPLASPGLRDGIEPSPSVMGLLSSTSSTKHRLHGQHGPQHGHTSALGGAAQRGARQPSRPALVPGPCSAVGSPHLPVRRALRGICHRSDASASGQGSQTGRREHGSGSGAGP